MITPIKPNYQIISYPKTISFGGYNNETYRIESKNKRDGLLHQTAFFRNLETLEFVTDYANKKFPKGTNIADFGCSNGEEAYSLMMLLNNKNNDKKYKITGFDLSPKVVELAKSGPFEIKYRDAEGVIDSEFEYKSSDKKYLRTLFFDCFENVRADFLNYRPKDGDEELLNEKIKNEKDLKKLLQLKCFNQIIHNQHDYTQGKTYVPKIDFIDKSIDFRLGDVNELSKSVKSDGKTGIIVFKNAWYHISGSQETYDMDQLNWQGVENVIKQAHEALPKGGLFVVGNLENDHLFENQPLRTIKQNGENIKVCDDTPLAASLKQQGFKPVFYEQIKDKFGGSCKRNPYLPSVWQKV